MKMRLLILVWMLGACSGMQRPWDSGFSEFNGKPSHWNPGALPIVVAFDPKLHKEVIQAYRYASAKLNAYIGRHVFTEYGKTPNLVIVPCNRKTCETAGVAGRASMYRKGDKIISADIKTRHLDYEKMKILMQHELGHVLGLAHDDNPDSIMYYNLDFTAYKDMKDKQFTAADIRRLKAVYSNQPKP